MECEVSEVSEHHETIMRMITEFISFIYFSAGLVYPTKVVLLVSLNFLS